MSLLNSRANSNSQSTRRKGFHKCMHCFIEGKKRWALEPKLQARFEIVWGSMTATYIHETHKFLLNPQIVFLHCAHQDKLGSALYAAPFKVVRRNHSKFESIDRRHFCDVRQLAKFILSATLVVLEIAHVIVKQKRTQVYLKCCIFFA